MTSTDTNTTYTAADRERLMGSGQVDDRLLYRLIEMAGYDKQSASVTLDREDESLTVTQQPHQGDAQTSLHYLPINDVVEKWLDSEENRTARVDIYDYEAEDVAGIREDIELSRGE